MAINPQLSDARFVGGLLSGVGLGSFLGYALREAGILTIKGGYLALPCIGLSIVGQMIARRAAGHAAEVAPKSTAGAE